MSERDLFANFDRMRREMDELFGDAFERSGLSRRRAGHWPSVDVAYASDPPRAIVTAELAGVEADQIALQIEGRTLILAGRRALTTPEGEVYQQVEIERGAFRRAITLAADVRADQAAAAAVTLAGGGEGEDANPGTAEAFVHGRASRLRQHRHDRAPARRDSGVSSSGLSRRDIREPERHGQTQQA